MITDNEYEYLINRNYQISNFYMNPKLHKYKELNKIIKNQNYEYINITKNLQIEGWLIVAGPVYYKWNFPNATFSPWTISFTF